MKALKALILVLVVVVVLVVGGVAALLAFVDPNDFKEQIADQVREATGRELVLEGPLELGLYPKIKLRAGPLRLGNAPGFGDEPFFAAEEIQVAVATLPLLRKGQGHPAWPQRQPGEERSRREQLGRPRRRRRGGRRGSRR